MREIGIGDTPKRDIVADRYHVKRRLTKDRQNKGRGLCIKPQGIYISCGFFEMWFVRESESVKRQKRVASTSLPLSRITAIGKREKSRLGKQKREGKDMLSEASCAHRSVNSTAYGTLKLALKLSISLPSPKKNM